MHALSDLRSGQLAHIKRLDLSCGLTSFPREIFDLAESLEVLNLSGNALDSLPDDLPRLRRLRVVFCSDNRFTRLPEVLGQCASLEMVGFKANQIRHVCAQALPPRLRWLILTDNRVEELPAALGHCIQLQKLMLAGNRLAQLPDELANLRQLELLRISANGFDHLPDWLPMLPRLAWLACAGNPVRETANVKTTGGVTWADLDVDQLLGEGASGLIYKADWRRGNERVPVALKLFKGEVTSDGWPQSEMAASLAAGSHPNLIPVAGPLDGHPQGTSGLVMHFIPPSFKTLAGPPSLASCTRDVYAANTSFSATTLRRIACSVAAAVAHLHARGLLHGDLYAHNLQCDAQGHCLLGDLGAASFLPDDPAASQALQRIEVRAFGCLLEELIEHADSTLEGQEHAALCRLRDDCLQEATAARPLFDDILQQLC